MSLARSVVAKPFPLIDPEDLEAVSFRLREDRERLANRSIFITGGSGLIGKWLIQSLLHADHALQLGLRLGVLCRNPQRLISEIPHLACDTRVNYYGADIRDVRIETIQSKYDYFIHAATSVATPGSADETLDVCVSGTHRAIELARAIGSSRFLLLSSGAIYGTGSWSDSGIPECDQGSLDFTNPSSAYAYGKRCAELLCRQADAQYPTEFVTARCFAMLGPYLALDRHYAIGNFIGAALHRKPIIIQGDGTPIRSYLYMNDVITHLLAILVRGQSGEAYNVGSDVPISIRSLAERVNVVLGARLDIQVEGLSLHGPHASRYLPSVAKIQKKLTMEQTVALDDAIKKTATWYEKWFRH